MADARKIQPQQFIKPDHLTIASNSHGSVNKALLPKEQSVIVHNATNSEEFLYKEIEPIPILPYPLPPKNKSRRANKRDDGISKELPWHLNADTISKTEDNYSQDLLCSEGCIEPPPVFNIPPPPPFPHITSDDTESTGRKNDILQVQSENFQQDHGTGARGILDPSVEIPRVLAKIYPEETSPEFSSDMSEQTQDMNSFSGYKKYKNIVVNSVASRNVYFSIDRHDSNSYYIKNNIKRSIKKNSLDPLMDKKEEVAEKIFSAKENFKKNKRSAVNEITDKPHIFNNDKNELVRNKDRTYHEPNYKINPDQILTKTKHFSRSQSSPRVKFYIEYTLEHQYNTDSTRYLLNPMICDSPVTPENSCPVITMSDKVHRSSHILDTHFVAAAVVVGAIVTVFAALLSYR